MVGARKNIELLLFGIVRQRTIWNYSALLPMLVVQTDNCCITETEIRNYVFTPKPGDILTIRAQDNTRVEISLTGVENFSSLTAVALINDYLGLENEEINRLDKEVQQRTEIRPGLTVMPILPKGMKFRSRPVVEKVEHVP